MFSNDAAEGNRVKDKCVVIGDIKMSSRLESWPKIFVRLEQTLDKINQRFSDDLVITFRPTVGDEFQGAIQSPQNAFEIYALIRSEFPVAIYCAIGIGDIQKPFTRERGMRGTAFYRARDALEMCKNKKRNIFIKSSDTSSQIDDVINTLLQFIEVLEHSWTERQREVVGYYRRHPDYTYEQLGKHFSVSKQSISQTLKAANWEAISEGENLTKELLKKMDLYSRPRK